MRNLLIALIAVLIMTGCEESGVETPKRWTDGSMPIGVSAMRFTVKRGGAAYGGVMPSFSDKLDDQAIDAVLAWVQSHWSDEIYVLWSERSQQAR